MRVTMAVMMVMPVIAAMIMPMMVIGHEDVLIERDRNT